MDDSDWGERAELREMADDRHADEVAALESDVVALAKALKALRQWHKDEYQSNPDIDQQADQALARENVQRILQKYSGIS